MTTPIKLIIGLGNPGNQYEQTRHNAGFWFLDNIAHAFHGTFKTEKKFFGDVTTITSASHEIKLIKPTTFMNRSGQSGLAIANFFKIPIENILVAHDELDLPAGTAKLKLGGGHGGHNGLRDLIAQFGNKQFLRLRIGINHPGSKDLVTPYVLGKPSASDKEAINSIIDKSAKVVPLLAKGDIQIAMQTLHRDQ